MTVGFKTTYNGRSIEVDDLLMKREFFNDGTLWTWGSNSSGQLGNSVTVSTSRSSPGTTASAGLNWKQVSVDDHAACIKTDGTLWTWGAGNSGGLGDGTTTNRSSPGTTAGGGTNWKQVACAGNSTAAIKSDGTLWTWGINSNGKLGDGSTTARSSPGTTAGGGANWSQVSIGSTSCAGVKTDGTLWTWGRNIDGQQGNSSTTDRSSPGTTSGGGVTWKQVSVATNTMAAVKTDGTLWTWGSNSAGQIGDNSSTSRSSPGTTAGGGTNWKEVALGAGISFAVKTDGTLWSWGNGGNGMLGDGTTSNRSSPVTTAGGGTNWKTVSVASGIKTDGTLWVWGTATAGQLGDNTATSRSSPATVVGGITNWKQVFRGPGNSTMAITDLTI